MLAGRYTLLDQSALVELLPRCAERGIGLLVAGVMNSGLLAGPRSGARFNYVPAPDALVARARRLEARCLEHGVSLRAAAVQFALAHPAVTALVAGVRSVSHLEEYPELLRTAIPTQLWSDLRSDGLIPPDAPTPSPTPRQGPG